MTVVGVVPGLVEKLVVSDVTADGFTFEVVAEVFIGPVVLDVAGIVAFDVSGCSVVLGANVRGEVFDVVIVLLFDITV